MEAVEKLSEAMGLKDDEVVMLLKKARGLCDAPKERFGEVSSKMTSAGWAPAELEPCLRALCDGKKIAAIDFLRAWATLRSALTRTAT